MKVTIEGKQHLGAVIGSEAFKISDAKSFVHDWIKKLKFLFIIGESEPQSSYSAFVDSFKGKLTYFMHTIPSLGELLKQLEDAIRFNFIPATTGGHLCSDNDGILLSLPVRFGRLAIPLFHNHVKCEYENCRKLTSSLTQSVKRHGRNINLNIKIKKRRKI